MNKKRKKSFNELIFCAGIILMLLSCLTKREIAFKNNYKIDSFDEKCFNSDAIDSIFAESFYKKKLEMDRDNSVCRIVKLESKSCVGLYEFFCNTKINRVEYSNSSVYGVPILKFNDAYYQYNATDSLENLLKLNEFKKKYSSLMSKEKMQKIVLRFDEGIINYTWRAHVVE